MQVRDLIAELQRFDPRDDVKVEARQAEGGMKCINCGLRGTVITNIDDEPARVVRHDSCVYIQL